MGVPYRRRRTASRNHVLFRALDTHNAVNCSEPRVRIPRVERYAGRELKNSSQTKFLLTLQQAASLWKPAETLTLNAKEVERETSDDADLLPLDT